MGVSEFLRSIHGRDLADIVVVAVIVYGLLLLIRGTPLLVTRVTMPVLFHQRRIT